MQIDISPEHYERLVHQAKVAGYMNLDAFIAALAEEPTEDPRGPLTTESLRESVAECERGIAEIEAGGGQDVREALLELGLERGYRAPQ
jgi:hypothetical protein